MFRKYTRLTWFRITACATVAGVFILTFPPAFTTTNDPPIREVNKRPDMPLGRTVHYKPRLR